MSYGRHVHIKVRHFTAFSHITGFTLAMFESQTLKQCLYMKFMVSLSHISQDSHSAAPMGRDHGGHNFNDTDG